MFPKMSVSAEHVYESDPLSDLRWETFIDGHLAASVFHGKPFLQALQITYGYSPVAVYINPECRTMQLILPEKQTS
jgi:hypothetical protein